MKRTYVNPTVDIVVMKTQQFMMMSNLGTTDETSGNLARELGGDDFIDFADDAITDLADDAITNFDNF